MIRADLLGALLLTGALLPVQVIGELRTAAEAANRRAAEAQDGARIAQDTMAVALSHTGTAEAAVSAALADVQVARAEAVDAQVQGPV